MFIGFHLDSSNNVVTTGSASVYIYDTRGMYNKTFYFSMNGKTDVREIGNLPAGEYNVTIIPNNMSSKAVYGGSIYSTNY